MKQTGNGFSAKRVKRILRGTSEKYSFLKEPGVEIIPKRRINLVDDRQKQVQTAKLKELRLNTCRSFARSERVEDRAAVLELLETNWANFPSHWSLERRLMDCSLNPPLCVPSTTRPISTSLLTSLGKSALGRSVLQDALIRLPTARLTHHSNFTNITNALKQVETRPERFRAYREYASDVAKSWDRKREKVR